MAKIGYGVGRIMTYNVHYSRIIPFRKGKNDVYKTDLSEPGRYKLNNDVYIVKIYV